MLRSRKGQQNEKDKLSRRGEDGTRFQHPVVVIPRRREKFLLIKS